MSSSSPLPRIRWKFSLKRGPNAALFLIAILPVAIIVRLISDYGVNVPYGDEWSLIPLFSKWNDHQLAFADIFRQHNEHRIFFPKLIYLAFAQLTHWNVRAEMFFSVLLCCGTSAGIYILLKRTVPGTAKKHLLLWALSNLLIFSPVQAENWLWGFQLQIFIPTFCLVASLAVLGSRLRHGTKFLAACLLAIVATFSFGGGLLLCPIILGYLALQLEKRGWLMLGGAIFILLMVLYFLRYHRQPVLGPQTGDPLDYLVYFVGFNGSALGRIPIQQPLVLAGIIGASAFIIYVAACGLFVRLAGESLRSAAPWLALGAYAICSAALAAYTRISWGPRQSLDSRYASISVNLYVALIALIAIASQQTRQLKSASPLARAIASIETPFLCGVLTLYFVSFLAGIDQLSLLNRTELQGLSDLEFCKIVKPPGRLRDELMISEFSRFMQDVDLLEHLHLLEPPVRQSAILHDAENRPKRSTAEFGRCDALVQKNQDTFEASGWSFLPLTGRPAPRVVLAYQSAENWIAFALSDTREARPNVVMEMKDRKYLESGWRKVFKKNDLPADAAVVSAWALDAAAGEVYKLPGDFALPAQ